MKVLSNLHFKDSTYILNKYESFPENPEIGMLVFKEDGIWIYMNSIFSGNDEWVNLFDLTRKNISYVHTQSFETSTWNVEHNLNSDDISVTIYDENNEKQIESSIDFVDDNNLVIHFVEPVSGKALIFASTIKASPTNIYTKSEINDLVKSSNSNGQISVITGDEDEVTIHMSSGCFYSYECVNDTKFIFTDFPEWDNGVICLRLTNGGRYILNFPKEIQWPNKVLPVFTENGTDYIYLTWSKIGDEYILVGNVHNNYGSIESAV